MRSVVCIDVFVSEPQPWMGQYNFKKVTHPGGVYYTTKTELSSAYADIIKACRRRHLKYRCYDKCWARSDDYRKEFFKANTGPYRCRYCNKQLSRKQVVVDHIIPVAKTKKLPYARRLLKFRGIHNVNDIRNLAPSCYKCNKRKGSQMGLWALRGWLGKYPLYWNFLKVLPAILFLSFIFVCTKLLK